MEVFHCFSLQSKVIVKFQIDLFSVSKKSIYSGYVKADYDKLNLSDCNRILDDNKDTWGIYNIAKRRTKVSIPRFLIE